MRRGRRLSRRHRMSGSRRSVPRPEHGASTITQSKRPGRAAALADRPGRAPRSQRRSRRRSAAGGPSADRARRTRRSAAAVIGRRDRRRLAAGDAQVSSTRGPGSAPASSATSCDASSCTTNQPASEPGSRSGCPSSTIERIRSEAARADDDAASRRRGTQLVQRHAQPVGAQRQRRRRVVEPHPRFGARQTRAGRTIAPPASAGCDSVTLR